MARPLVQFDKEVQSGVPITWGRHQFLHDKDADFKCMGWKLNTAPTKLWFPGMPVPEPFRNPADYKFAAFNIQFDQLAVNVIGPRYGFKPIEIEQCIDVMAIAARYGLPQSLDKLGKALGVKLGKMSEGKSLVKLFCTPPFHNPKMDQKWHHQMFRMLCDYCVRDVDSMDEILHKLPSFKLSKKEQHIWQVTAKMNAYGVPVDSAAVIRINQVVDYYTKIEMKKVSEITDGAVSTIGQTAKIVEWCKDQGHVLPNLQAQTVKEQVGIIEGFIEHRMVNIPFEARLNKVLKLLKLRQKLGGAAVKKFVRLQNMAFQGRIHDNARYHGAGTGRSTGGGFQLLNMPRAKIQPNDGDETYEEAVERVIQSFYDTTILSESDPLGIAKALVRPMIRSIPDHVIMAADWASIEYILLMWFAGEWAKVERFREGYDPYIDFATKLFHVKYDDVTSLMRQQSKPPVLGSGYMLGSGIKVDPKTGEKTGLIAYAKGYGIDMTDDEAVFSTNTYRNDHKLVVKSWYAVKQAAHMAVKNHRVPYVTHRTKFIVEYDRTGKHWLVMTLPSGRALYYCQPRLVEGQYGPTIKHRGVDPIRKIWSWVYLNPQRIIENIIQGLGRDVLTAGRDRLKGYTLIADIYDEVIVEEPEDFAETRFEQMKRLMCVPPSWAPDLPLFADGFIAKRYKKH